jgi:hypothetical protein
VHLFESTNDGIHRAGFDADGAPDASVLINDRDPDWPFRPVIRV